MVAGVVVPAAVVKRLLSSAAESADKSLLLMSCFFQVSLKVFNSFCNCKRTPFPLMRITYKSLCVK